MLGSKARSVADIEPFINLYELHLRHTPFKRLMRLVDEYTFDLHGDYDEYAATWEDIDIGPYDPVPDYFKLTKKIKGTSRAVGPDLGAVLTFNKTSYSPGGLVLKLLRAGDWVSYRHNDNTRGYDCRRIATQGIFDIVQGHPTDGPDYLDDLTGPVASARADLSYQSRQQLGFSDDILPGLR